jgi:glycosyltransferase involved in cell wall biosynthesis
MQDSIVVSVIIATYNMRPTIGETLDSILSQQGPDTFEVIVVDDGSTDGTGDFLREKYGERIRYIYQENKGRAAARNAGFAVSHGKYIQFFDADDIMEPNALGARLAFLQENLDYAVAYGSVVVFMEDDPTHFWEHAFKPYYKSGDILKAEIHRPFLIPIMALIRREWVELVGAMEEDRVIEGVEDWYFFLNIAINGGLFAYIDGPAVARYRWRRNHPIGAGIRHGLIGMRALEKIKPLVHHRLDYKSLELDKAIATWQYGYGYGLAQQGEKKQGLRLMVKSLRHNQERISVKMIQIILGLLMPPDQIEPAFYRLRKLLGNNL